MTRTDKRAALGVCLSLAGGVLMLLDLRDWLWPRDRQHQERSYG